MPKSQSPSKTKKLSKDNQLRIPRPLGLTLSLRTYHKTKDLNTLNKIKERVIEQWIGNDMMYNDRIYNIQEMSGYLNMPSTMIMKGVHKVMEKMGRLIPKDQTEGITRALFSKAIILGSEIQSLHARQVRILFDAQGDNYKPFVSGAVNQALANWNSTQTAPLALLRMLTEKQSVNIFNPTFTNPTQSGTQLTAEMAMKLIHENQQSMLEDSGLADKSVRIDGLPDINPRSQNVGLITQPKLLEVPNPIHPAHPQTHEDRRERQEFIKDEDIEEEDFRM